jgi:hypothetical protein
MEFLYYLHMPPFGFGRKEGRNMRGCIKLGSLIAAVITLDFREHES